MTVSHALPREAAFYVETAFVTGGPASWSANGTYTYVIEPDVSQVMQSQVANENNRLRPFATHQDILTLKNSEYSHGKYAHGSPANAAEAAAAVTFDLSTLVKAALGGMDLGWGIGVASDGNEATDEIQIDSDPGYAVGDYIFAYDTSASSGQFYRILAIDAGPPVTLTLDRDLHFDPDNGGADRIYAVIDCYIHQAAVTQHDHADHKTLQWLVQGEGTEDVYVLKGCKPSLEIEAITAGEPTRFNFNVLVTTFDMESASKVTFSGNPSGEAGSVPGQADDTLVLMSDAGGAMASVTARGSITPGVGVAYDRVMGPNGYEGVHGHVCTLDAPTLEVIVPHDNAYNTEFRAQTEKQCLVQVGTGVGAWGLHYPQLSYASEPIRSDEGGLTSSQLSYKARENQASPGGLTGDNLQKWRSPIHILFVA